VDAVASVSRATVRSGVSGRHLIAPAVITSATVSWLKLASARRAPTADAPLDSAPALTLLRLDTLKPRQATT